MDSPLGVGSKGLSMEEVSFGARAASIHLCSQVPTVRAAPVEESAGPQTPPDFGRKFTTHLHEIDSIKTQRL